jgi:response regulator NasT
MEAVLLVSSGKKQTQALSGMLAADPNRSVTTASNAQKARDLLSAGEYAICLINSPLFDESGEVLACEISSQKTTQVILLVLSEQHQRMLKQSEAFGFSVLPKPITKALLQSVLNIAENAHQRLSLMQKENQWLKGELEYMRVLNRAKLLLISRLSMSEAEAHRHIEKRAMDLRRSKRSVAEEILKTYDD